ncbi:hypothetical protein BKI52_25725 [marine bacterium AO1-C]|nr:hypothetical protein BKI52_25725 [marine bacterium AO1-C]
MIICFEGASAVGKTTLSRSLSAQFDIIAEANQLFTRTGQEERMWYFHKQVERYQMACQSTLPVILDCDVFQPLWYNWIYDYPKEFPSRVETHQFYREQVEQGQIAFPDLYIIFYTTNKQLRQRKQKDATRTRRNFEKHLQLIEPQKRYFQYLKSIGIAVEFIDYQDFDTTKTRVSNIIASQEASIRTPLEDFQKITAWLDSN